MRLAFSFSFASFLSNIAEATFVSSFTFAFAAFHAVLKVPNVTEVTWPTFSKVLSVLAFAFSFPGVPK